jgi:hypothetical protein
VAAGSGPPVVLIGAVRCVVNIDGSLPRGCGRFDVMRPNFTETSPPGGGLGAGD